LNLFDTSEIPHFPKSVLLGWSKVRRDLDSNILSDEEQKILKSFTNDQRKGEFLTARHLFWKIVKEFSWDIKSITLKKEPFGKPIIESETGRKYVSFTHSQNLVMCAISNNLDIGLDAETLDRKVNPAIVKRILSENEWGIYGEDDPIALWTMKESAVKSLGTGLRTNLKELQLEKYEDGLFSITFNQKEELQGICFRALNHCIALAY
tara:strand:- start:8855 stop:9478 length:624 start_codon:yes stop_codon:yes gene_type:complete